MSVDEVINFWVLELGAEAVRHQRETGEVLQEHWDAGEFLGRLLDAEEVTE